jgi:large subunit ribosomal protein L31
MKSGIHPEYREVVFVDVSNDFSFVTRSTVQTREKVTWKDGKEYPLFKLDTSSESHPFYTGAQTRIVEAGRVEKFRQKFAAKTEAVNAAAAQASAAKSRRK